MQFVRYFHNFVKSNLKCGVFSIAFQELSGWSYNYCKSLSIYYNYNSGDKFLAFVLGLASAVQQGRGEVFPIMVNSTSQRLSLSWVKFYLAGAETISG